MKIETCKGQKVASRLRNGQARHDLPQNQGKSDGGDWLVHSHLGCVATPESLEKRNTSKIGSLSEAPHRAIVECCLVHQAKILAVECKL